MCSLATKFLPHSTLPHIYTTSISHFSHESSKLQYHSYSTMGKQPKKCDRSWLMNHVTSGRLSNHSFLKTSTHTICTTYFQKCISLGRNEIFHDKGDKTWQDHFRNFPAGIHHFPGPTKDTRQIVTS